MKVEVDVLGFPVPNISNNPYGLCGRKATQRAQLQAEELCESGGGRPG